MANGTERERVGEKWERERERERDSERCIERLVREQACLREREKSACVPELELSLPRPMNRARESCHAWGRGCSSAMLH